ncbi:hypothetical protein SAMN05444004_106131 [Jannaschia faecimaris]|uniref:Uncharacterized protein n=1 Tax=Jannaschia faecimaris TaxID=1244108 RepID=A0A1H3QGF2_9RHOB|nr:hypothetical protein [Jannaschia faecimaris]SDZ12664.1 hypothetical protein SAMN05444004_106131 [Jannaschia faecimaris]
MRPLLLATLLAAFPSATVAQKGPVIECYCTDSTGGRVEMGELLCLSVGGRAFMARCEMSLNVPMWRETGETCVTG